jgi:hypothetical protein
VSQRRDRWPLIDIEPEQIVRWLVAEHKTTPTLFRFDARRGVEVRDIPPRPELHLGDEEREELREVATVATLEVTPAHASDVWILKVTVEDETGPRVSSDAASEQKIDLGTFYHQFIRSGRGTATASAEVQDPATQRHLNELLDAILVNRHPATTVRHS